MTLALQPPSPQPSVCRTLFYLFAVGIVATFIGGLVGFLFVAAILFPLSLSVLLFPSGAAYFIALGMLYAAPVTLVVLPTIAFIGRNYPLAIYFALPLVGAIAGFLAMECWIYVELSVRAAPSTKLFNWAAMIAGMMAGGLFSAAVREMRR